jgi:hypothetical protein
VRVLAALFIGLVVIAAVAVASAGAVTPRCGLCHRDAAFTKATKATGHGSVPCASCHVGSSAGARASYAFQQAGHLAAAVIPGAAGDAASVPDDRCLSCHGQVEKTVVERNGLRIKHSICARGATCVDCHSTAGHGTATKWARTYDMDRCLHCHGPEPKLAKCDLCHRGRSTSDRLTTGPWKVTHGPSWRQTHGMGDEFTCSTCHPKGYCDKCHGPGLPHGPDFRATHPAVATNPDARCSSCHKPKFCTDCHGGLQMPHPQSFLKTHSRTVETGGSTVCQRCHSKDDCTNCHVMHVHPGGARMHSTTATGTR